MTANYKYSKTVRRWLVLGLILLIGQVILGGITRLTGSGLSITRWDIVLGVIPPLNQQDWEAAFDLYKQTPQYHKINSTFELADFKFIYFWEYIHRLWVRSIGLIFFFPFVYFLIRKKIDLKLSLQLLLVVVLAGLTASAGWIMVQSGLVNRPWVNAYKLMLHFIFAVFTISAMVKAIADAYSMNTFKNKSRLLTVIIVITLIQFVFAGLMAGMKAGLYYPTWPDMNGTWIPEVLLNTGNWNLHNLTNYDRFTFAPALVQFVHRILAYILFVLVYVLFFKCRKTLNGQAKNWLNLSFILINLQLILGILIVMNSQGSVPVSLGVLHQLTGLLFYIAILFLFYPIGFRKVLK